MLYLFTKPLPLFMILSTALLIIGCSSNTSPEQEDPLMATIILTNNGASSYTIVSIDGDGALAEVGTENPSIQLIPGGRYTFINQAGASSHPLDFRSIDGEKLFGQGRNDGLFDDNMSLDIQTDGDAITFTLSNELSALLGDYICAFHPGMNGLIEVLENE